CGLALDLPAGSRLPYAVNRRGAQSLTAADGRPRLEADFGRTGTIHVRWQTANTADVTSATVAVQEAYLWDLAGAGATLQAGLRYGITGGSISSLSVELPRDVLVTAVAARSLGAGPATAPTGWLRKWRVTPHDRGSRLALEFGTPIAGNWQVTLGLVPRAPWPAAVTLSF